MSGCQERQDQTWRVEHRWLEGWEDCATPRRAARLLGRVRLLPQDNIVGLPPSDTYPLTSGLSEASRMTCPPPREDKVSPLSGIFVSLFQTPTNSFFGGRTWIKLVLNTDFLCCTLKSNLSLNEWNRQWKKLYRNDKLARLEPDPKSAN